MKTNLTLPQFNLEYALEKNIAESKKLCELVIISLLDPESRIRLAAINGLHRRYQPQIRKSYVIDNLVFIETPCAEDEPIPYLICRIPQAYLGMKSKVIPWNLDLN